MADAKPTKGSDAETPAIADAQQQAEFPLPIDEFCARLSLTDKRVELITAFARMESAAGRRKDVHSAYARRFGDFINQPA